MGEALRSFVLMTLTDTRVDTLNFRFGSMRVYPIGFRRDIARGIRNRSIVLTSDPSGIYSPGSAPANASYVTDTPPGEPHPFFINPRWTESRGSQLYLKPGLSTQERAGLRGTIVHEATHALQDYQRASLDPRTAEGAAYLTGAITRWQWGYRTPGGIANPQVSGHAYALYLADRHLAETDPARRYVIPEADVRILRGLVTTGATHRYVFNGI